MQLKLHWVARYESQGTDAPTMTTIRRERHDVRLLTLYEYRISKRSFTAHVPGVSACLRAWQYRAYRCILISNLFQYQTNHSAVISYIHIHK